MSSQDTWDLPTIRAFFAKVRCTRTLSLDGKKDCSLETLRMRSRRSVHQSFKLFLLEA